jgi:hypothetical protein
MKFFKSPPLKFLWCAWFLVFTNYLLGPIDYQSPSIILIGYLLIAIFSITVGFGIGGRLVANPYNVLRTRANSRLKFRGEKQRVSVFSGDIDQASLVVESLSKLRWIVLAASIASAVGSAVAFRILTNSGRTIQDSIELTGLVRQNKVDDLGMSSVIANMFGFLSMSLVIISFLYILYNGGLKRRFNLFLVSFSSIGVAFLLLTYVVNVNRTAFLILFLLIVMFPSVFYSGSILNLIKRVGKVGVVGLLFLVLVIVGYIFFIAVKRSGGDSDNDMFISSFIKMRYNLPFISGDLSVALNKLLWYASHQFSNFDLILNNPTTPLIAFKPSQLFFWVYQQLGKFFPELSNAFLVTSTKSAEIAESAGAYSWQWNTGFCAFIFAFGILGSIPILFVFSATAGFSYARYIIHGSVTAGLLCLWLLVLGVLLFVYFPVDNFVQSNFFYLYSVNIALITAGLKRP